MEENPFLTRWTKGGISRVKYQEKITPEQKALEDIQKKLENHDKLFNIIIRIIKLSVNNPDLITRIEKIEKLREPDTK